MIAHLNFKLAFVQIKLIKTCGWSVIFIVVLCFCPSPNFIKTDCLASCIFEITADPEPAASNVHISSDLMRARTA